MWLNSEDIGKNIIISLHGNSPQFILGTAVLETDDYIDLIILICDKNDELSLIERRIDKKNIQDIIIIPRTLQEEKP